jgi:hypothetical protein
LELAGPGPTWHLGCWACPDEGGVMHGVCLARIPLLAAESLCISSVA